MGRTLRNLSGILALLVISLFLAWFYLRNNALTKPLRPPMTHAFLESFKAQPLLIAHCGGSVEAPANTLVAFEKAAALTPDLALWADVRPSKDGTLMVYRDRDLDSHTDGKGWVGYTSDDDLAKLDAGFKFKNEKGEYSYRGKGLHILRLQDLLERFPDRRWILNFQDDRPELADGLIKLVEKLKLSDRILIASPEDGLLRDLREKKPMWLFGTSQAQVTRIKMLDSLGLAAVVPLQGDVFIFEASAQRPSLYSLSVSLIEEIHRRKMKIIAGPVRDREELAKLSSQGIDGILLANPGKSLNQASH
jgi:glycerophosphoryl diester phosphodiesterase